MIEILCYTANPDDQSNHNRSFAAISVDVICVIKWAPNNVDRYDRHNTFMVRHIDVTSIFVHKGTEDGKETRSVAHHTGSYFIFCIFLYCIS